MEMTGSLVFRGWQRKGLALPSRRQCPRTSPRPARLTVAWPDCAPRPQAVGGWRPIVAHARLRG